MEVKVGQVYRHFKGMVIEILHIGKHTETMEDVVVYTYNDNIWVRPLEMFKDKVDKEKYPEVTQEYRFELIDKA